MFISKWTSKDVFEECSIYDMRPDDTNSSGSEKIRHVHSVVLAYVLALIVIGMIV